MKKQCRAVIPFRLPFPREGLTELTRASIRQILSLSQKISLSETQKCPVAIKRLQYTDKSTEYIEITRHPFRQFVLLEFSAVLDYEEEKYRKLMPAESEEFRLGMFNCNASFEFGEFIHKLVFCANIASPGSIHTEAGAMYIDEVFDRSIYGMKSSLELLLCFREYPVWPPIQRISLRKTWNWLDTLEDFRNGFGSSSLGRALALFSHLFSSDYGTESPMEDLYTIAALEAIYQSNGSQRELATKCQLFLGSPPKGTATIPDLYKIRSSLIHGGTSMPFWFSDNDALPEVERFREKSMEFWDSSLALLISTFQKMCRKGIQDIEFEIKLKKV